MNDFTEVAWRARVAAKLQQFKQWFSHGEAPYLAYGTVAGLSLWPLVEAAGQAPPGHLPFSLTLALGSVAGGVGTNLIAEQLQRWRNRAEPVTENEVITWIQDNVATEADLLSALDAIIAELDAIPTVQSGLSVSDQEWFTQTLRQELSQLGNSPKYSAVLHGSGAIAQGKGATAVGERGVNVQGNVTGSINTGDTHTNTTIVYGVPPAGSTAVTLPPELAPLRQQMVESFNLDELQLLASDLGIAYDDLPHDTRSELAESLIGTCHRNGRLPALLALCRNQRPHIDWPRIS